MADFSASKLVSDLLQGIPANAVLRERLTLAMEQKVAAEAEAAALQGENETLLKENAALKQELAQLKGSAAPKHDGELEPVQEQILKFLSDHPNATIDGVTRTFKIKEELAEFHLTELHDKHLIDATYSGFAPTVWYLLQEGRRYLIKRKLL